MKYSSIDYFGRISKTIVEFKGFKKTNPEVTKENIEVIYNGNETIVIIRYGKRFYEGLAKCSSEDTYDKEIGFQVALS